MSYRPWLVPAKSSVPGRYRLEQAPAPADRRLLSVVLHAAAEEPSPDTLAAARVARVLLAEPFVAVDVEAADLRRFERLVRLTLMPRLFTEPATASAPDHEVPTTPFDRFLGVAWDRGDGHLRIGPFVLLGAVEILAAIALVVICWLPWTLQQTIRLTRGRKLRWLAGSTVGWTGIAAVALALLGAAGIA